MGRRAYIYRVRILLYSPYVYALVLVVLGFIASRRAGKSAYFWGALLLAEVARGGLVLFLVENFGHPIYLMEIRGQVVPLRYPGLYIAGGAALAAGLIGLGMYLAQRKAFPGLWVALLSFVQVLLLAIVWMAL